MDYLVRLVGTESEVSGRSDVCEPAVRTLRVSQAHPDFATAFMELLGEVEGISDVDVSQAGVMTVHAGADRIDAMHTQLLALVDDAEVMAATSKQ